MSDYYVQDYSGAHDPALIARPACATNCAIRVHRQVGQPDVGAVLGDQPGHAHAPTPDRTGGRPFQPPKVEDVAEADSLPHVAQTPRLT